MPVIDFRYILLGLFALLTSYGGLHVYNNPRDLGGYTALVVVTLGIAGLLLTLRTFMP